ncbi:unnamed protein product [Paramecium primaurelia]|uniref:Uncharacterized protein n=1 Tax=Paramecium primaurelia TaxID=5886 RepID=A0A8S1QNG0_PARPR|nr:unnamed protein product [Paramecium primaurelia]
MNNAIIQFKIIKQHILTVIFNCPFNCQHCHSEICIKCSEGYYLDFKTNSCESVCGDKIMTPLKKL